MCELTFGRIKLCNPVSFRRRGNDENKFQWENRSITRPPRLPGWHRWRWRLATLAAVAGCQTESSQFAAATPAVTNSIRPVIPEAVIANSSTTTNNPASFTLREGDILKISFPGSPNLNNVQQIRTDGKITPDPGRGSAGCGHDAGRFAEKIDGFIRPATDVEGSHGGSTKLSFPVYVTGAVLRPGKISSDHPITALEAIMEAGGFDYTKANLKNVKVIRQEGDRTKNYMLDLKRVMEGKTS